ncbi:MAG: hypothetical protein CL930_05120 [Deltaproteobacteria bacterium]|nr:hypothetical protein [Deltaproteobacteria bacterium]|tara:strand:- start:786 stop:1355 length:570 start_codon:yes stop_codon:yes gene_type:complete
MAEIINFPVSKEEERNEPSKRVQIIDQITNMSSHELEQVAPLFSEESVSIQWVDKKTRKGITHTIGPTVYRRVRKDARILQADAVAIVTPAWLECAFEALEALRQQWGGRITLVWTLVNERPSPHASVSEAWSQLVADGSPLERVLVVDSRQSLRNPEINYGIPEPTVVVHPEDLESMLDSIVEEDAAQ